MDNLDFVSEMTTNEWDLYTAKETLDFYSKAEYLFNEATAREKKLRSDVDDSEALLSTTQKALDDAQNKASKLQVDNSDLTVSDPRA